MMGRPLTPRRVACRSDIPGFKPMGVPARNLQVCTLTRDELEALRLADLEGLYHEAAAERMGVSRPTFGRVLERARRAVAQALLEGRMLLFAEGPVQEVRPGEDPCPMHGWGRRRGRGCRCRRGQDTDRRESDAADVERHGEKGENDA